MRTFSRLRTLTWVLAALVAWACAPTGVTNGPTPGGTVTAANGYLEGLATVGPLTPVERVDLPAPTPSPELCTALGLTVLTEDGATEVARLNLSADCSYRIELRRGAYVVHLKPTSSIQFSKDLPKTAEIESGKTTRLDFHVDTGIR